MKLSLTKMYDHQLPSVMFRIHSFPILIQPSSNGSQRALPVPWQALPTPTAHIITAYIVRKENKATKKRHGSKHN